MEPIVVVCIVFFGILMAILGIAVAVSAAVERKEQKRNAFEKANTGTTTELKNAGYYCELCRLEKETERKFGVDLCEECYKGFSDVLSGDNDALEKYSDLDSFPDASPNAIKEIIALAHNKKTAQKEVVNVSRQEDSSFVVSELKEDFTDADEEGNNAGSVKKISNPVSVDRSIDMEEYYKILGVSEGDSLERVKRALKTKLRRRFSPLKQEIYFEEDYYEKILVAYLILIDDKSEEQYVVLEVSTLNLKDEMLRSFQAVELARKLDVFLKVMVMKVKELIMSNKIGFGKGLLLGIGLFGVGIWMTYESQFFIHNILKGEYTVYYGLMFSGIIIIIRACVRYYSNKREIERAEKEMWDNLEL